MKLKLPILAAFLGCSTAAQAQVFAPGYLVRSTGDTLRGEIENGFWVEPPVYIRYRANASSESQLFKPRQLRAVNFTGGRAFRYEGLPLDHAAREKVGSLPYENRPDIKVDSLLAEVLVDGPVSLVRVNLFDRPTHYVLLGPGQPPLDLSERKYLRQTVGRDWLLTDGNNYRGQLGVYFGQCPAAYNAAKSAPFTAKGLTEVVQVYNRSCSSAKAAGQDILSQAKPQHRVAFQGGLLAGMRYNRIEGYSFSAAGNQCGDCQPHPFAGLYAELLQPSRTSAVYGELSVSQFRNSGALRIGYNSSGNDVYSTFDYRAWLGTARIGLRYFVPMPQEQQLLLGFGFELNKVINPEVMNNTAPTFQPSRDELYYARPTVLPHVMVGWRVQRFTLSLDGQMYISSEDDKPHSTLASTANAASSLFVGSNFAARLGFSCRLGRNPDQPRNKPATRP